MKKETLEKAKILEARICQLKTLRVYLNPSAPDHSGWWHDFVRLILPKRIYSWLYSETDYDVNQDCDYDEEFCKDSIELIDSLILKYEKNLLDL